MLQTAKPDRLHLPLLKCTLPLYMINMAAKESLITPKINPTVLLPKRLRISLRMIANLKRNMFVRIILTLAMDQNKP